MLRYYWERWLRGLGLSFYTVLLIGVAWGIPFAVGKFLDDRRDIPDVPRMVIVLSWLAAMLVLCPLAFEWLTRKCGITMDAKDAGSPGDRLEGPRVVATPLADGGRKCGGCGAIVNAYAVRCHQCGGVFVDGRVRAGEPS